MAVLPLAINRDPGFDINTATNTFYKTLGDRVASGQMTLDQARAAQAEMRALQLNPAAANRQTATDIAQRHLQVGRYSPSQPNGGLTLAATRPDPQFDINTATNAFYKTLGDRVASGQMTLDQARAAQAEMRALQLNPMAANRAAATEVAQRNLQLGPYAAQPRMPMAQPHGAAAQPAMMQPAPRGMTLSNVPMQGAAPQPMSAPQGMAMGGLMEKYYGGGMC